MSGTGKELSHVQRSTTTVQYNWEVESSSFSSSRPIPDTENGWETEREGGEEFGSQVEQVREEDEGSVVLGKLPRLLFFFLYHRSSSLSLSSQQVFTFSKRP